MSGQEDQSDYYTVASYGHRPTHLALEQAFQEEQAHKLQERNRYEFSTTLETTKMSVIDRNEGDMESCFGELEDIVEGLPSDFLRKIETPPQAPTLNRQLSRESQRGKERMTLTPKSYWINQDELRCTVELYGRREEAVCRFANGQLVIVDGGCRFKLERMGKIKALYENYQRCLWITCQDESKGRNEVKFKISIENDARDDLYLLLARIVVAKLTLLGYDIDPKQQDCPQADRFIISGDLLKKSQFLGRWQQRRMVVTDRIESFKDKDCTFEMAGIRELWTRFEVHKDCIVVKLRHGMMKTELALPIVNFTAKFAKENWLYPIYRLVSASAV